MGEIRQRGLEDREDFSNIAKQAWEAGAKQRSEHPEVQPGGQSNGRERARWAGGVSEKDFKKESEWGNVKFCSFIQAADTC